MGKLCQVHGSAPQCSGPLKRNVTHQRPALPHVNRTLSQRKGFLAATACWLVVGDSPPRVPPHCGALPWTYVNRPATARKERPMSKHSGYGLKPHQGAISGQQGPSAAKQRAAHDRQVVASVHAHTCAPCPYAHASHVRCAWACALAHDAGVPGPHTSHSHDHA